MDPKPQLQRNYLALESFSGNSIFEYVQRIRRIIYLVMRARKCGAQGNDVVGTGVWDETKK